MKTATPTCSFLIAALVVIAAACHRSEPAPARVRVDADEASLDPEKRLIKAAQRGDLETIERLLASGVDINAHPSLGITALWQACWSGHIELAKALLKRGADPNVYDQGFERSPLMMAQDPALITLLVARGAADAPYQLCQSALDGSADKVQAILAGRPFSEEELRYAKANALLMGHGRVAELLDSAAGQPLPPPAPVDAEQLQLLAGEYRDARLESMRIRVRGSELVLEAGGEAPQALLPSGSETFQRGANTYRFRTGLDGSIELETLIAGRLAAVHTRDPRQPEDPTGLVADPVPPRRIDPPVPEEEEDEGFGDSATWPQFRGHAARGIARRQDLPSEFSAQRNLNIRWTAPIPGFGVSSPIVWRDKLFLTTAVRDSGSDKLIVGDYTDGKATREDVSYTWKLYCLDSASGRERWQRVAASGVPRLGRHPKSSYANPTPVTDGEYVVALFNSGDLQCFTVGGELVWKKQLGLLRTGAVPEPEYEWGFASSPTIHGQLVIVQCDLIDESYVAAYELRTGRQAWKTERDEPPAWGTPLVVQTAGGHEVVTSGSNFIRAYDVENGQERWKLPGMSAVTVPTPQAWDELLFVASGQLPTQPIFAIRSGDAGAGGPPQLAWSHERGGPYVITPLVYQGRLYVCSTNGVLTCYDARTGQRVYRERISRRGADSFSASPVAADGRIYFAAESGAMVVVRAGPTYSLEGVHATGDYCLATPAIAGGRLFVRTRSGIVAIGSG